MNQKSKEKIIVAAITLSLVAVFFFIGRLIQVQQFTLLSPQGPIAHQQTRLLVTAVALMLLLAIPVFTLTIWFSYKYRAGNPNAEYSPNGTHNPLASLGRWAILITLVAILGSIMWPKTHELDPRKVIASNNPPITIQVVAMQWKWLFIYPQQNIATVNFVEFPEDTPIIFELTADAPMNSFWIPALGGQMYAMAGMTTHLNLMADQPGDLAGSAAEISGEGFADMKFTARVTPQSEFEAWTNSIKLTSANSLNMGQYSELAKPGVPTNLPTFNSAEANLFEKIQLKYLPASGDIHSH